jgi:hypothetical protein
MNTTTIDLSAAAIANVQETGIDPSADVERIRSGSVTREALLAECLDGADEDRVEGWREYVSAVVEVATAKQIAGALIGTSLREYRAVTAAYSHELYEAVNAEADRLDTDEQNDRYEFSGESESGAEWTVRLEGRPDSGLAPDATEAHLATIRARRVDDVARDMMTRGLTLTHEQADALGQDAIDWMAGRLRLDVRENAVGVVCRPR